MTVDSRHGVENGGSDEDRMGLLGTNTPSEEDLGTVTNDKQTSHRANGRVQFDSTPEQNNGRHRASYDGSDEEAGLASLDMEDPMMGSGGDSHRVPLLTNLEAPSVRVANEWGGEEAEEAEAEMRRPKSGLKSAFMNMANSIIGAGIIGQPYAMRQAGLIAGIILLVGLTVIVDWTICLIVINSKLSGTSNFQGTVEYCFGRPGLIAISLAQWVFAFGGMVAFGVIVGDTIPHVLAAVWSDLHNVPVIGWMTDRRVAILVFVMGISYPLTLYRDIAKVSDWKATHFNYHSQLHESG